MSVVLRVPAADWRAHQRRVLAATPGLVPVAKGNGYGFGLVRLAGEAAALGVDTLAVGTPAEVAAVRDSFGGRIVVLQPWRPGEPGAEELLADERVIHTVSRVSDLEHLSASGRRPSVLLELLTSMKRHGMAVGELTDVRRVLADDGVDVVGWTVHLPMPAATGGNAAEAERLAKTGLAVRQAPAWFSHLTGADYDRLRATLYTGTRLRIGTELWLGGSVARRTTATVLDVHKVARGEKVGYWQHAMPADGHIVVLSGGTAHGIALEAPTSAATGRQRLISAVNGSVEALGWARSPFTIAGKKRWFVEPPHMQASMVFVPGSKGIPAIGDEIPVELRLTTATVDEVVLEE
jgi:alanine racemase